MDSLSLYTYKPSGANNVVDEETPLFIQGIIESINDRTKSKMACFLEMKREQMLIFERLKNDLLNKRSGDFYRNHILLDMLSLYKTYSVEFSDETSSFDREVLKVCADMTYFAFELFSYVCKSITIFVRHSVTEDDDVLLTFLKRLNDTDVVVLIKTVSLI
ncbi:P18 [Diatraea saccharalis granulovirus]|uniref:p18 n=1 Tax=Diatraea saccharalis granulovirus TaxID=1675862 RepID=A0A0R7EZ00_9BBAC|nr:P18 [Diatraea saccharalis granulovirus]AKN80808.1 P18 [Diatraea saccharalis granulovirus]